MALSGCLESPDGNDTGNGDGSGPTESGKDQDEKKQDGKAACDDEDPPTPAHPDDHRVESRDEIRCPGHYAILDPGGGNTWEVPSWEEGDWWKYQRNQDGTCHELFMETVSGTDTAWNQSIYVVDIEASDCDGTLENAFAQNRTQHSLSEFAGARWNEGSGHGYINHNVVFPLNEGKRWAYMNAARNVVDVDVSYRPNYLFGTEMVEAWYVHVEIDQVEIDQWYGVEERNLLYEEWRTEAIGLFWTARLTDSG